MIDCPGVYANPDDALIVTVPVIVLKLNVSVMVQSA